MGEQILQSPLWRTYEDFKRSRAQDPQTFLPDDTYEINFLTQLLEAHYPQYTDVAIRLSIRYVQRTLYAGCRRTLFVQLVVEHLLQRTPLAL